jgi:hypothetical protein
MGTVEATRITGAQDLVAVFDRVQDGLDVAARVRMIGSLAHAGVVWCRRRASCWIISNSSSSSRTCKRLVIDLSLFDSGP